MKYITRISIDSVGVDITFLNSNNSKYECEWHPYECDEPLEVSIDFGHGRVKFIDGPIRRVSKKNMEDIERQEILDKYKNKQK